MAYASEITAKLGIDTSSVGTDLQGAKNQFNKWGNEVASSGAGHGENFGGKLVGGLEHKILGAKHLSGALAAALGLNIEKISEHIAAAIMDGSKEGWTEALKIAEENAKLIGEKITEGLTPKGLEDKLKNDLKKAIEGANAVAEQNRKEQEKALRFGFGDQAPKALNADQLAKQLKAEQEILKIEAEIAKVHKADQKEVKDYENEKKKAALEDISDARKAEEINKQITETTQEIIKGGLTEGEIAKKKIALLNLEHELKLTIKRITEEDTKLAKKDAEDKEKAQKDELAREDKLFSLKKSRFTQTNKLAEDENKVIDRSKLTVGELANLQASSTKDFSLGKSSLDLSFGNDAGLNPAQVEAKRKAQEIQRLEDEAERRRLGGDITGSEEAFGKVGQLRDELTNSGFTKSTEGDKFGELKKQIAQDGIELQKTLKDLIAVEKGKFVSQ